MKSCGCATHHFGIRVTHIYFCASVQAADAVVNICKLNTKSSLPNIVGIQSFFFHTFSTTEISQTRLANQAGRKIDGARKTTISKW